MCCLLVGELGFELGFVVNLLMVLIDECEVWLWFLFVFMWVFVLLWICVVFELVGIWVCLVCGWVGDGLCGFWVLLK